MAPSFVTIASLLVIAAALMAAATSPPKSHFWVGEIEGVSMLPTLRGERYATNCRQCGRRCEIDATELNLTAVFQCEFCNTWQKPQMPIAKLPADRVMLTTSFDVGCLKPGVIIAVEHPLFGLTGKRIASVSADGYFVVGDNPFQSLDSRNSRFGLVARDQIRGIVIKIIRQTR